MHEVDSQSTDTRALRAEYSIVGIPHKTAIQEEMYLFGVLVHACYKCGFFATFSVQRSHTSQPSRGCQYFHVAAVRCLTLTADVRCDNSGTANTSLIRQLAGSLNTDIRLQKVHCIAHEPAKQDDRCSL